CLLHSVTAGSQKAEDARVLPNPSPIYPSIKFQIFNADHVFLGQGTGTPSNSSLKVQAQTFFISSLGAGFLQPAIKASFGPLAVDATIPPDLLLSGRKILAVLLVRQVRSSHPFVKILFHMPTESNITFRGACLVSPGGFCVAQLKPEPFWFSSGSRSGSSSREAEKTEAMKGLRGNLVEIYFQSRRDQTGQCLILLATILSWFNRMYFNTFSHRAAVKSGLSFSAARPSDPLLWDIIVEPGRGATPNAVTVTTDILNTAVLTGKMVSVPVKTLAVEANGTVTDVTNFTNCKSAEMDVLKVSERCNYVFVNGKETRGKSSVMINFTYGFLSAQLEMSVWMPRLPLLIDIADPELSQIKGWRIPVTTGPAESTWDSEEDEDMRKGRGCMLQYQLSTVRVLTPFVAQPDSEVLPDAFAVDVTDLVRYALKVADPEVARVQDGVVLQGRAVGTTVVQVLSPVTSLVLAERSIRVVDDKVSVTELGVQLVSGLSLSLQLSPGKLYMAQFALSLPLVLLQEAVVTCWVQFSDGAVAPLELFDRGVYSLTVSTNDERVATVRRTPLSTFVVAQGEGEGRGRQVKVELRICEECQKSKRKSKLAVGAGILKTNFQSGRVVAGEASKNVEAVGGIKTAGTLQKINLLSDAQLNTAKPTVSFVTLSDLEIGMYSLIGVSCIAIMAFLLNCASYRLCFRKQKTPIQTAPPPTADPKDHKHDWVWMGSNSHNTPPPGAPAAPAQAATLKPLSEGKLQKEEQNEAGDIQHQIEFGQSRDFCIFFRKKALSSTHI
uniref:Uncharacterized protein n=1 Tax=Xiphophorus couchianus TaxID=32473 RepID=A0A3B5L6J2_9TELE